jgi:hypothetical protein
MKLILGIVSILLGFSALTTRAQVVPIFEMKSGGLLGGTENGKFLDAKTTFGRIRDEQKFSLFGIKGKSGELTATLEAPGEPCDDFYTAKTVLEGQTGTAIGAARRWNPVPRTPSAINLNDKTYLKVVADFLRLKGVPQAKAKIEQAVKIDLDGDGTQEVLLTASSYGGKISPRANANDYSFILLRKIVAGKAKNILIAGDFIKKNVEFGAPSRFELSSIVDLDGDGRMEIVIFDEYYEGQGASVYELKADQVAEIEVLNAGCGV